MPKAKRRPVRVGIIGMGRSGFDIHAAHMRRDRRFRIVAVADPVAEMRAEAVEKLGVEAYAEHAPLLAREDLDLVIVAAPSHLHMQMTLEAFKAGHHVLCEKPLAQRARDVDRMIAASKRAGKLLAIYQQSRFAPYYRQVCKVIDSGVLGRIVMIKVVINSFNRRWDWQTLQEYGGGCLLNTGAHMLDQLLPLYGAGMPEVKCAMDRVNPYGDAEDHVKVLLTGKNRPTVDLEISHCAAYRSSFMYKVYGSLGGMVATRSEAQWRYYQPERAPKQRLSRMPLPGRQWCREELPWIEKSWAVPKSKADMFPVMARAFYDHLYAVLTEGTPLIITPQQVRRQIAVIEECHRQNPLPNRRGQRG